MEVKTEVAKEEEEGRGISRAEWKPCRRLMSRKIMFLAPNTTLSPSGTLGRGIMEGEGCQDECMCVSKYTIHRHISHMAVSAGPF